MFDYTIIGQIIVGDGGRQAKPARHAKTNEEFNKALLKFAQEQIQVGQASSYIKAINEARKVRSGEPKYEEAQKLIVQWSNTIFSIAKVRAKNKNLSDAILAGELVPYGTPAYESSQKALRDWKIQKQTKKVNKSKSREQRVELLGI